ncbi:hypothetical protein PC121_g3879 [Phytophthora cactorum]|nr:hypothetical protein PC120_g5788 [Phytophthora cactorum]KAG3091225.1 hypothetical protein PC121_g3879 [Phytophthora cactorum]KAG4057363.1 hypothetical protein PC123_g7597 [Phytophthora cactorum]
MEGDEVLNAVFRFKHKVPSDRQEAAVCNALVKLFAAFVASLEAVEVQEHKCGLVEPLADDRVVPASAFTVHEMEVLRQTSQRLTASGGTHKRGDVWYGPWLPKYGCVLQRQQKNAVDVTIQVVSVDGWERKLHFLPTGACVHSAVPSTYSPHPPQCCAVLGTELEAKFSTVFASELRKAHSSKGSERSAATNELGHQKTPQFIAAVVKRAVASLMGNVPGIGNVSFAAQGGTTDVGQHTGGRARDTCWALVQEVIARNLSCEQGLFRKTMVAIKLKLLQQTVDKTESVLCGDSINLEDGCPRVDDLFYMLEVVVQNTVELLECKYDVSEIKDQCAAMRSKIDEFIDFLNRQTAARYILPEKTMLVQLNELHCGMEMVSPQRIKDSENSESAEERHQRAWKNLEGCYFLNGVSCTLTELLQWGNSNDCSAANKCILMLRTFESFMFEKSLLLNGGIYNQGAGDNSFSLERIQMLVTQYQQDVTQWRRLPRMTSVLNVEQRSREMLVMWIAFCLVHQKCVDEVPLCAEYNIALDWNGLNVAVLRDRAAISALQRVATYIRGWNETIRGTPLFHLTNQKPTFDFGRRFGLSSTSMIDVYNREVEIWNSYVRGQWGVVENKKREAAQLRADINFQNQKLSTKRQQLANEEERLRQEYARNNYHYLYYPQSAVKTQLKNDIGRINSVIRKKEAALSRALAVPRYLVRPLPPATNDAIQVIFMLTMPRNIEILGSLCLTAQRALAPADATSEMARLPALSPTTWQAFYSHCAPSQAFHTISKVFTPNLAPFSYPHSLGPKSVDDLCNLQQYSSECVWNPTLYGTALTWTDSFGHKIDPFAATESSVINSFTETMPEGFRQFQWMNKWPGEGDTRGNIVYASLHKRPDNFEKVAFIALGSLRAFPNQQYRKLQWALLEDILPWSNPCVETVVRQSLYQVGALTDEVSPQLLWKMDMLNGGEGLDTFCATLENISGKLEQTPRNFENVPLFSELAGFALQYSNDARRFVKTFAGMTRRWAEDARSEYKEESSPRRIAEIRRKECVLYGFALLAYSLGPWDDEAAQEVCELIVLFRTSFLCASINVSSTDQMLRTESKIAEVMSRRITELINYVKNNDIDTVLTALVRLVSATSPERLEWKQFRELSTDGEQFGSCFEAVDTRMDVHYSINLFTGIVLTDGYAPGGLPIDIRTHERFQSLFGPSNFEVFSTNGLLRTERKYCGRLYDFALEEDDELFVQELVVTSSGEITSTLQRCTVDWVKNLRSLFPAQLRKLYSHWYWVEQNCVLFRPQEANCREVFFIATFEEGGSFQCYKVPFSDTKRPYEELLIHLDEYDQFVRKEESLLGLFKILTKFEEAKFLHPLRSPEGVLKIELPRLKLTLSLNSNLEFESVEHKGYILATNQQFDDFLPRFSRYLLLELQDKSDSVRPELRMLLPVGSVEESSDEMVDIIIPGKADSMVEVHCYDVHRRLKTFETETIGARLQLAAVCTRAGTNVPSRRLQMTGAEAAMQMLRACRSSRPFSSFERDTLLTIYKLSYREPAVKILAVALLREANRLGFLFGQTQVINTAMACIDERTEYDAMCMQRVQRNPLRSQFRSNEEKFVLGHVQYSSVPVSANEIVSCEPSPVADDYVKSIEMKLKLFLQIEAGTTKDIPQLPLDTDTVNAMSKGMLDELQVSWKTYHSQAEPKLKAEPSVILGSFTALLSEVSSRRGEMETYLEDSFSKATSSTRDQLLALANYLPLLTVTDIVRCAFDEETLRTLAPKLSEESREQFKKAVLQYMELCVLEDKMERLIWKAKRSDDLSDAQLIDELMNVRQWQSTEFPYWLAFEVEGRLQIRHEQFVIAQHLINGPGTVCQLNMGRGKTRVILPMLFLHFTQSRCPRVVRAHFLSPLLSEARQFMHRYLSASSAHLGVFEQPFHRQIDLDARRLEFIRNNLDELKLFGGIQLVAPEHRMSLELKRLELGNEGPNVEALDEILDSDQFVDVLDECDALLHHKYHLVYAVGTPISLCSGVERWKAAEALLRVVADKSLGSRVATVLQAPHVSCVSPDYAERLGAYDGTRLNTVVESTKSLREELKEALARDLITNAPFELMWLNTFGSTAAREPLVKAITDSTVSLEQALGTHMSKLIPYMTQLLALRGLVAFGVFEHCLEKRYRVNFGIPVTGSRPKKIAIPFRAADVPSERSEFSHPDVCIVLTLLGYYHRGLSNEEVRSTFQMLLRLDTSEQQQQYDQWFKIVKSGLSDEVRRALCDVRHISLDDARQFETLCKVYNFCMEAINFYLNTCVFPKDTQQYPQRLSRTAWNLAAGKNNIGFSGTNDNHRLLPLSVTQREPDEPSLLGTNGKMIDKILQVTHSYEVTRPSPESTSIPWQNVLFFAMDKKAQALIDTGALLAGVANHDAAKFLLERDDFGFAGVAYFDSREENNCWMIAEKARRIEVSLKKSSMLEKETFVIFDEARSRGSDMKLLPDAAAVLTLGPKLTKDKLMQGAGRMRQLGCNQSLWITSFDEVAQSILQISSLRELSSVSPIDVLNWVMDNTKTEAVRGLLEWAGNGIHFRKTQLNRGKELVDENWQLETLYRDKVHVDRIAQVIQSKALLAFKDSVDELVRQICCRGFVYGLDDEVCVTSHTDECERELQVEEEVQQERELEVMKCSPTREKRWAYDRILHAQSVGDLTGVVQVLEITRFIRQSVSPKQMVDLDWTSTRIYGTINFFATIQTRNGVRCLNEFLRVIDVVLVFKNGDMLLVSECEADHILELLWSARGDSTACSFSFVNLAFACESLDRGDGSTKFHETHLALGSSLDQDLPLLSMIACHVYNGETMLAKHQENAVETACRALLGPLVQREATLSNFVKSRGNSHKWTRSFLHELCCRMDLEDCQ